jgi:gluconolactonase
MIRRRTLLPWIVLALSGIRAGAQGSYPLGPDSQPKPGVPQGTVTHFNFKKSKIFPGTNHDTWVYIPKQYDGSSPAAVMVFQDGGGFQGREGQFRVPVVFDNLIAAHQMPVTIAVMVNPGVIDAANGNSLPRYNRSHEYDATTDDYARFVQNELLPAVEQENHVKFTTSAAGRGLCGASSGGICSFIAAWEHPEWFSKVISFVGSFTDLQGGNTYASAIRKYEPRPIRVVLQDGSADQDIYSGVWFLGNTDVAMALAFGGYEYQFVKGTGGHNGEQGGQILPDALKFVWKDYPNDVPRPVNTKQPVMQVVQPGETWQDVTPKDAAIAGLTSDVNGSVTAVSAQGSLYTFSATGEVKTVAANMQNPGAAAAAGDGSVWVAEPGRKRIRRISAEGKTTATLSGLAASALVESADGSLYVTEAAAGRVWHIAKDGKKQPFDASVKGASGVTLTPDQTLLHVSTTSPGKYVYSYTVASAENEHNKQKYFDLRLDYATAESLAQGMATDTEGRLYVTSNTGIQLLDQAGRVIGVLENPFHHSTSAVAFGGAERDVLYTVAEGRLYKRKVRSHGVTPFTSPIKPPQPRL